MVTAAPYTRSGERVTMGSFPALVTVFASSVDGSSRTFNEVVSMAASVFVLNETALFVFVHPAAVRAFVVRVRVCGARD